MAALQFAIAFAQATQAEVLGATADVLEFAEGSSPEQLDAQALIALHDEVRTLLLDLVNDGYAAYDVHLRGIVGHIPDSRRRSRHVLRAMMNRDAMSVRDRFIHRLVYLLETVGRDKIHTCKALRPKPDDGICGRVFLKVTRKEYCSVQCQSRMNMRNYRQRNTRRKGARHGKATRTR
jgi:hypothetical protein